jgi:hypothetical protein
LLLSVDNLAAIYGDYLFGDRHKLIRIAHFHPGKGWQEWKAIQDV